ncbi:hypothetical protein M2419_003345 [Sphingobacterium sp. BIGb0116]|nr:hypothetical protein [Sphingobacterium sp. BIGb0116]
MYQIKTMFQEKISAYLEYNKWRANNLVYLYLLYLNH